MSRSRGVPIGLVWSLSDGSGTVRTRESARAGVAAAGGAGRGRETRGRVEIRLEDGRGAPPGPNPYSTAGVHCRLQSLFVGESSTTEKLGCQAKQRRTQSNRWS